MAAIRAARGIPFIVSRIIITERDRDSAHALRASM